MNDIDKAAVIELSAFCASSGKSKRVLVDGRDFYSLSCRYSGKVLIKTAENEFVSGENSITFMPKGLNYETEVLEPTHMAVIHFKLNSDVDFRKPSVIEFKDRGIQLLFEKLVQIFRVDTPVDFSSMAIFYELLARLEAISTFTDEHIPKKIRLAKECITQNFFDSQLSISSVAERLGVSTAYLRREFSLIYKKSPVAFLRDIRIGYAKNLLQSEYLTVEEIAEQSGFSSSSYFIQVFRKCLGTSPDRYRRKL